MLLGDIDFAPVEFLSGKVDGLFPDVFDLAFAFDVAGGLFNIVA